MKKNDYDLIVLGGGLQVSCQQDGSGTGKKVALIEKNRLGETVRGSGVFQQSLIKVSMMAHQ